MIDMLAKVFIVCILATAIVANPVGPNEDDDDIPVYTEKVMQGKPTKAGRTVTRIPRFNSKKLSSIPKKAPESNPPEPYIQPLQHTSAPKVVLKTTEPIRSNVRPVRRSNYPHNSITDNEYSRLKPALRGGYNAPRPSYAPAPELGVEYALDAPASNHQAPAPVDNYRPRRVNKQRAPEYGSASGNEPELSYAAAPQKLPSSDSGYNADYKDEHPQPYIFGYEFKDENGATQNRKEQGDDYGNKRGSYGYTDEHGIYRQVDYIADAHGFRAVVKTNEPGTDNQNPADVEMQSEAAKH